MTLLVILFWWRKLVSIRKHSERYQMIELLEAMVLTWKPSQLLIRLLHYSMERMKKEKEIGMRKLVKLLKLFNETTGTRLEYFNTYSRYWNDVDLKSKYSISQFLRKRNYNGFLEWLDRNRFIDYKKARKKYGDRRYHRIDFVYHWVEYYYTNEYGDRGINLLISLLK